MRDILTDLGDMLSHPDPVRRAQIQMKKPLPKRFYATVSIEETASGHGIHLDGKPLRTPGRQVLAVKDRRIGEAIAEEWNAQGEVIDPATMPVTRLVNTALDGVANAISEVQDEIARYAGTDLLCYRADAPNELVDRQARIWDPVLQWAASSLGARLILAEGVIHQDQPEQALAAVRKAVSGEDDAIRLAALHTVTTLTGSALLALALAHRQMTGDQVWDAAHLDEDWNIELWGADPEAEQRRAHRKREFDAAALVLGPAAG